MRRKSFEDYTAQAEKCGFGGKMSKADYEGMDDDEYGAHMAKLGKAEDGEDPDEDDDPERDPDEERDQREDPDEDESEKSMRGLTEDELSKAMDRILASARTSGKTGEQLRLEDLSKASAEGTLTAAERVELVELLESVPVGSAAESFAKSMDADPDVQDALALDATELVSSLIGAVSKSLEGVGEEIGELRKSTGDFNRRLAEGLDVFARTVNAKFQALAQGNADLTARLAQVEKSAVPYRGHAFAPQTPMAAVHDPRAGVPVGTLSKGGQVPTRTAKLVALDMLEKSADPNERTQLAELVQRLDMYRGPDWRAVPEAAGNPALTARVIAQATTA